MSEEKGPTVLSALTWENSLLLLSMAIKLNGGTMVFPKQVAYELGDVEHMISRNEDGDIVITLEAYPE
jgi:hypothetical protein